MTEQPRRVVDLASEVGSSRAVQSVQPDQGGSEAVPDEWLLEFAAQAKKLEDYQARLQADAELLGVLQFSSFTGPGWEELATIFAEYGYQVIRGWITSGQIYGHCVRRRISLSVMTDRARPVPSQDDIDDLAQETVGLAIVRFRTRVLIPRKWTPEGGASLKTYFIGHALFVFGDTFRRWALGERRQQKVADGLARYWDTSAASEIPLDKVIQRELLGHAIATVDQRTLAILTLTDAGYDQSEIAEILSMSTRSVEGRLYRHRKRMEGRDAVA